MNKKSIQQKKRKFELKIFGEKKIQNDKNIL